MVKPQISNFFSSVRARTAIEPEFRYDKFPKLNNVPPVLEMDYSRILNKPFLLNTTEWTTSTASQQVLAEYPIPSSIIAINELAKIPFTASCYFRAKISAIITVAGTPMHQGVVLASAIPISNFATEETVFAINRHLAAPHVFLHANEATPVVLEIPFYVNGRLAAIDLTGETVFPGNDTSDYAMLRFLVLNALNAPTSGSLSLSISTHIVFKELEFYVPHVDPLWRPFPVTFTGEGFIESLQGFGTRTFDGFFNGLKTVSGDLLDIVRENSINAISNGRELVRKYTGLHAPDVPFLSDRCAVQYRQNCNLVDSPIFIEKMDPYANFTHVVNDYTFDTEIDEMHLKEIITKPQYIGTFNVKTTDTTGTILWSRPITPLQEIIPYKYIDANGNTQNTTGSSNLLQTFHLLSKYWRGSIKIHLQAVMTNFHYCRLILARDYSPDLNMLNSYPDITSVTNLLSETIEFSAGGQVQTIELPYCSMLSQLPCSTDYVMNALSHGMYYIYLYQPLVTNGSVPTSVSFNVYISAGDDFDYMGYAINPLLTYQPYLGNPIVKKTKKIEDTLETHFVAEAAAPVAVSNQFDIDLKSHQEDKEIEYDLRPIKHVRDYIRRFYKVYSNRIPHSSLVGASQILVVPVARLLGQTATASAIGASNMFCTSTLGVISRMFLGYTGGIKVKIILSGTNVGSAWYVPPNAEVNPEFGTWGGTEIVNLSPPAGPATATLDPIVEMFQFPDNVPPARTYSPSFSIQTVTVERPNYSMNYAPLAMSSPTGGSDPNVIMMNTMEFEFEVPYMSPLRFTGDASKLVNSDDASVISNYLHDLGNIVIKFGVPTGVLNGFQVTSSIGLEIMAACTDESRFGYQVFAPGVAIGSIASTSGTVTENYQLIPSVSNIATTLGRTPYSNIVGGAHNYGAMYYSAPP